MNDSSSLYGKECTSALSLTFLPLFATVRLVADNHQSSLYSLFLLSGAMVVASVYINLTRAKERSYELDVSLRKLTDGGDALF